MDYLKQVEDLCKLKGYSQQTVKTYCQCINQFLRFLEKTGLNLNQKGVKSYLLSLELSTNSCRLHYAALRFLFKDVLKKPFTVEEVPIKKKEKTLPKVIPKQKIKQIIESTKNIKHRLVIKFLYSSGIRLQELINLKRTDIDFDKNLLYVRKGEGRQDFQ